VGDGSVGTSGASDSSRFGGSTIRATSVILALRRKIDPKGKREGALGGITFATSALAAGFKINGESVSSPPWTAPVEGEATDVLPGDSRVGSGFLTSAGGVIFDGTKGGGVEGSVAAVTFAAGAAGELDSGSLEIDSGIPVFGGFGASGPAIRGPRTRRLPVCRSVCTGSASAISCSIFFKGAAGVGGALCGALGEATSRPGGRSTTPCVAGRVRVVASTAFGPAGEGVIAGVVAGEFADLGGGLIAGGIGSEAGVWAGSGAAWKAGGESDSGLGFLALKKISGQGMVVKSCAQFQGM
jgi:hypothetical protein